ncbi:MAG: DNA cytosine methyltransferase [Candidatus Latescibacteria bacterium]|nr:DNA cytosine methyltransferase [Candidatus Latescibacterota bacterium]
MRQVKIFDLFCGTGGFSKGFEKVADIQYQTVLGVDLLPIAVETFCFNHREAFGICKDIRTLRRTAVSDMLKIKRGELDLIIGGPPCQGFSSIRPFRSCQEDDPRNSLFEEYASFVNFFRPKAFVLENVVGLATHKKGSTIEMMEECFYKIGYECDWKILNTAHFGIPQKRERLIFIGVVKGNMPKFPLPNYQYKGATIGHKKKSRMLLPKEPDLFIKSELNPSITVMDAIDDLPPVESGEKATVYVNKPRTEYQRARRNGTKLLTLHEATNHSKKMLKIIHHAGKNINSIPKHLISSGFSSCYSRLDANEPATTITVNFVHPASNRCIHPLQNRALTPREGARLQSFDDDFVFAGTRSQIVKQIGNAVPTLLGQRIGEALVPMF